MRDRISFILNGELVEIAGLSPTTTLLDWLRRERRLGGTKEGCAEGDCGACTVAVRSAPGEPARAVNACILLLPMLDGASITTVEGLSDGRGGLHPAQQAMVDCHGSQCGFCTPGFVMSLYAAYVYQKDLPAEERPPIDDTLAGNLCRCTGYGPIVAAAKRMFELPAPAAPGHVSELPAGRDSLAIEHPDGRFHAPTSRAELIDILRRHPTAQLLGGATDIGLWVTKQHRRLPVLVATARVPELLELRDNGELLRIGAAITYSAAIEVLGGYYPALGELMRRIGSVQVRNSGTIGGNIANGSPIGDMPPALIALGATLVLNGADGERRLPLEEFFIAYGKQDRRPGEFVEAVEVPVAAMTSSPVTGYDTVYPQFYCYKVSKRFDQDISAICGAFAIGLDGKSTRIAFGGMAATPKRARAVEAALVGKPWCEATVRAAMPALTDDFKPISDMRASADYRLKVAQNLLLRAYFESQGVPTQLVGDASEVTA